jgi:4-amino-4-deoxy-L-arabinose transferase-like glycosyltransferase
MRASSQKTVYVSLLVFAALCFLALFLGDRVLWTMENRWADVVMHMLYSGDYFHPYIENQPYFDKPVLSYWLIIAASWFTQDLNAIALRLPSVVAAFVSLYFLYRLVRVLSPHSAIKVAHRAVWMMLTTFYFIFWARIASSDMLTLMGTLIAVTWYAEHPDTKFKSYFIFFIICALTSLCKGLLGFALPLLVILPHLLHKTHTHRYALLQHLNLKFLIALIIGIIIFCLPYIIAGYYHNPNYQESGLYLVYRENILRFFQPFDNFGPWYTYLIFLPVYLLPWTLFFIPAFIFYGLNYKKAHTHERWMWWSVVLLFLFFTASGSRRNYYVLPILPYALALCSFYIERLDVKKIILHTYTFILSLAIILNFFMYLVLLPWYYSDGGRPVFAARVHEVAHPFNRYDFVMLNIRDSAEFYLKPAHDPEYYNIIDDMPLNTENSAILWPFLLKPKSDNIIYVSRMRYLDALRPFFKNYRIITTPPTRGERYFNNSDKDAPVAFIPAHS